MRLDSNPRPLDLESSLLLIIGTVFEMKTIKKLSSFHVLNWNFSFYLKCIQLVEEDAPHWRLIA
jgi:hypothetical protein